MPAAGYSSAHTLVIWATQVTQFAFSFMLLLLVGSAYPSQYAAADYMISMQPHTNSSNDYCDSMISPHRHVTAARRNISDYICVPMLSSSLHKQHALLLPVYTLDFDVLYYWCFLVFTHSTLNEGASAPA